MTYILPVAPGTQLVIAEDMNRRPERDNNGRLIGWRVHRGIDIAPRTGEPAPNIVAVDAGTVVTIGRNGCPPAPGPAA